MNEPRTAHEIMKEISDLQDEIAGYISDAAVCEDEIKELDAELDALDYG